MGLTGKFVEKIKRTPEVLYQLFLIAKDKRTPLLPRLFSIILLLYLVSPLDLIADAIPFLGFLDDLVIIPIGFKLLEKWLPEAFWHELQEKNQSLLPAIKKVIWVSFALIMCFWIGLFLLIGAPFL